MLCDSDSGYPSSWRAPRNQWSGVQNAMRLTQFWGQPDIPATWQPLGNIRIDGKNMEKYGKINHVILLGFFAKSESLRYHCSALNYVK